MGTLFSTFMFVSFLTSIFAWPLKEKEVLKAILNAFDVDIHNENCKYTKSIKVASYKF